MRNNAAHAPAFSQTAARNMLQFYAQTFPAELPLLIAALERRPVGLGQETTDERSWLQRGWDAVKALGSEALVVIGSYKLQTYQQQIAQQQADAQWEAQLTTQRQQAELYASRAVTLEQRRLAQEELIAITKAETKAKWSKFTIPLAIAAGLAFMWMIFRK